MRIFLVDDHPVVLDSLMRTLDAIEAFEVVGSADSGKSVRAMLPDVEVDLLLLDVDLPDSSGIELLRWLREVRPQLAVVLFSMHQEQEIIRLAYRLGARGFIRKSAPLEELVASLCRVGEGGTCFDEHILRTEEEAPVPLPQGESLHAQLSDREMQILLMIAQGLTQKEICHRIKLSQSAVATYTSRVKAKLGVHSLAELISYCTRFGLRM